MSEPMDVDDPWLTGKTKTENTPDPSLRLYGPNRDPDERSREMMRQSWRDFEAQTAKPEVVHRQEILKVTQSYLSQLGYPRERVEIITALISNSKYPSSFTEDDVLEDALEILHMNT